MRKREEEMQQKDNEYNPISGFEDENRVTSQTM